MKITRKQLAINSLHMVWNMADNACTGLRLIEHVMKVDGLTWLPLEQVDPVLLLPCITDIPTAFIERVNSSKYDSVEAFGDLAEQFMDFDSVIRADNNRWFKPTKQYSVVAVHEPLKEVA